MSNCSKIKNRKLNWILSETVEVSGILERRVSMQ
jgi:putative transposon-encoded protein